MAKLILSMDGLVLKEIPLSKERTTIGRKAHNDIQIDNLAVSGEHAVIVTILNDSFMEDLGSTNGTLVNGVVIKKHILQNNDVIEIGRYQLRYINQKAQAGMDFDRTMMMMPMPNLRRSKSHGNSETKTAEQVDTAVSVARAANASFPLGGVKGLEGTHAGQTLELSRPLATFGKSGVQVAVINRRPHGYTITHVEGKKHPLVNMRPIDEESHALQEGDEIEVGGERLEFFLKK